MIFTETSLAGAYVIEPEKIIDERGFFSRSWCEKEFLDHGINTVVKQCNISYNKKKGTLRGMHYQIEPNEEEKLVRCTKGEIFDVIVDVRPDSCTYMQHLSFVLNEFNHQMLFIPKGMAHGFLTMEDNTEVFYQMSEFFNPESANAFRWDDPLFKIEWPKIGQRIISEKDKQYPAFIK